MRLLFLLPSVPDPPDSGARLRNLGLLRIAAREHTVDAIAFGDAGSRERLARLVRHAEVVPPPTDRSPAQRVLSQASQPLPDMALRLWSIPFLERLHQQLARERYDLVQAEGIEMAGYLRATQTHRRADGRPYAVYDAHNAEFLLQRRAFESAARERDPRAAGRAAYSLLQWRRLEHFERSLVRESHLVLAVSHHDANQIEALAPECTHTRVVPSGIDVVSFPFREPSESDPPHVLFLGKLDFRPNAEALAWFVRVVLPPVLARRPDARFYVVGRNPPDWIVALGQHDPRVVVTGHVVDERRYLARASIQVLPMQAGGGSRLKALVSFASGVPVVSTRIGLEGIEAESGVDFALADSPAEWATAIANLHADPARRQSLATSARQMVGRRYDWDAIAPALLSVYAELETSRVA